MEPVDTDLKSLHPTRSINDPRESIQAMNNMAQKAPVRSEQKLGEGTFLPLLLLRVMLLSWFFASEGRECFSVSLPSTPLQGHVFLRDASNGWLHIGSGSKSVTSKGRRSERDTSCLHQRGSCHMLPGSGVGGF